MNHHNEHLFRYWGKADPAYPGEPKWHPLVYHCLDVAACGLALLESQPAWLDTLTRLSVLQGKHVRDWVVFLLALHDSGKFGDGFQSRCPDWMERLQGRKTNAPQDIRHDTLGYELLRAHLPDWIVRTDLGQRGGSLLRPWLAAVTGHHGKPPRGDKGNALVLRNQFPAGVMADAKAFIAEIATLLLADGCPLPQAGHCDGEAAKTRMGWKELPNESRPTLAHVAYEAGGCWLRDREERLGCSIDSHNLHVDGHQTWRQRSRKNIELATLDFEGSLTVTGQTRFLDALFHGVGRAKSFGCGLMLVRRA